MKPNLLGRCLRECGVSQREFAREAGVNPTSLNLAIANKALPKKRTEDFKTRIQETAQANAVINEWLTKNKMEPTALWTEDNGQRVVKSKRPYKRTSPFVIGNPEELDESEEAEMLSSATMKHFKMFKNPFSQDITNADDIYNSEDHIFIRELMLDSARNSGFSAIWGEVGSGKSVMRKAVCEELKSEGIAVIYPVILDKTRITPASLLDAIIMDISEEKPKMRLEQKTRQALKLLRNRAAAGLRQVLIIEEAHQLDVSAFKALKQIYELEDGFRKLCGIILIGQSELQFILDENQHHEMREVIRRVTVARISGLSDDLKNYLAHKFRRIGKKVDDIFSQEAYEAFRRRLKGVNSAGREEDKTYPLSINNLAARAMNMAARIGEEKVTADIVLKA